MFELSQTLRQHWLTADYYARRRILEIVCLNCRLDDATLVCEMRKPFDALVEGLISKDSRGNWTAIELFRRPLAKWDKPLQQLLFAVTP